MSERLHDVVRAGASKRCQRPRSPRNLRRRRPPIIKKIHKKGTEQVPLQEEEGLEAFLEGEVRSHAAGACYQPDCVKIGYETSFTRYSYRPQPMRTLEEIGADILALEQETEGLFGEIIGGGSK